MLAVGETADRLRKVKDMFEEWDEDDSNDYRLYAPCFKACLALATNAAQTRSLEKSAWDAPRRLIDPRPDDTRKLRKLAEQPGQASILNRSLKLVSAHDFDGRSKLLLSRGFQDFDDSASSPGAVN